MEKRGRPFEPGNKFGRGRPRGSRNKVSSDAKKLLAEYALPLLRKAIGDALTTGGPMLRMLTGHVIGPVQTPPVNIGPLATDTPADVSQAIKTIVRKVTTGKITAAVGQELAKLFEVCRRVIQTEDHEERLRRLEPG